jgi:phage/plasmid-associated DNA primase
VPGWREDPVGSARYGEDEHLDKLVEWARRVHGDQPAKGFLGEPPPHVVDPNIPPPIDSACEAGLPEFCDDALALLFSQAHAANLRYVALLGKWLLWADTHWFLDETLKAFDLARAICRSASARVPPKLTNLAAAVASAKTVAAVERLAKADRQHASTIDQWDKDDWLFNKKED